jgi:hypothetical protein
MSDVLFDTGKHTLRPLAREKLAKISGIVLAYPALTLGIEGNTDSVGSDAYNQGLSGRRRGGPELPRAARNPRILDDSKGPGQNPTHCIK